METQFKKKITWVIKNFPSLQSQSIYSDHFLVGGCKWTIAAYPNGCLDDYWHLSLEVANYESLPTGWRIHSKFCFVLVNQHSEKLSKRSELQAWFDQKTPRGGNYFTSRISEIHAKDSAFLVNGELKIVLEIDVLEVIGKLGVLEETSTIVETVEIHGFQVLPSQEKYVSRLFERHPEIASEFRPKNPNLKTCYMSMLLCLIETICKLPQEISKDDLVDAYVALRSMRDAGFELDWLERKLDEVSETKQNEEASEAGLQEMEEELNDLKEKCLAMEAIVEKKKEKVSVAKAPISFDDVV